MAWGLIDPDLGNKREDLLDLIGDVSPDRTPLVTLFGTSTADATYHQWLVDSVSRPTSNRVTIEGADASFGDLANPTRVGNVTQIITRAIQVSRTARKVNQAGMSDPYIFQKAKGLRKLKMDMEYAVLNAAQASGASGVARSMKGVDAFTTSKQLWRLISSIIPGTLWHLKILKIKISNVKLAVKNFLQDIVIIPNTTYSVVGSVL